MTVFVVGPDDAGFFKRERTTWEFEDALNAAEAGDRIEIQRNYNFPVQEKNYTIEKNLTIYSASRLTHLNGEIFIKNGAHVKLENFSIISCQDKSNCLQVREGSSLEATNLSLTNMADSGENYPIIYLDASSYAQFDNLRVSENKIGDGNHRIYVENSTLTVTNSELNCKLYSSNSEINFENTSIDYSFSNTISVYDQSKIAFSHVTVTGGNAEKDYPAFFIKNSTAVLTYCVIDQNDYSAALCEKEKSNVTCIGSIISSVSLTSSKLILKEDCRILESIALRSSSILNADDILLDGKDNGKINLFATDHSTISASWIGFAFESSPNIKLEDNVQFNVNELCILKFDSENDTFVLNDKNEYPILQECSKDKIKRFSNPKKEETNQPAEPKNKPRLSGMQQLDEMIGLETVKQQVKEFIAVAVLNKKRQEKGLSSTSQTLHSLFLGNPGTGKTTVARIVGHILYEKGVIAEDKLIETSRADLVAGYVGQTAEKTRKVLESALGGILFVDEAYTLASGGQNDFGKEAIDEILKFMEDYRSNIMIIFAGYTDNMEKFLETNPGLRSRIPNKFDFEDYSVEEMVQIGLLSLRKQQYKVDPTDYADLLKNNLSKDNDKSNGRWVRNLNGEIIKKQAVRVTASENYSDADLVNITKSDLDAVKL